MSNSDQPGRILWFKARELLQDLLTGYLEVEDLCKQPFCLVKVFVVLRALNKGMTQLLIASALMCTTTSGQDMSKF